MIRALIAAALWLPAGPADAFLGFGGEPRGAVLWVPSEPVPDWTALEQAFARHDKLRLTIALSPELLNSQAEKALSPLIAAGRVEVALRLSGDPILPLIADHPEAPRPQDPVQRVAAAKERYRLIFSSAPAGLAPGGGAVSGSLMPGFRSLGLAWVGIGEYAATSAAWAADGGLTLVPMRPAGDPGSPLSSDNLAPADGAVLVIDETAGLTPPGALLRLLSSDSFKPPAELVTVSALAQNAPKRPVSRQERWPSWSGGLELWTSTPLSKRAWKLYGSAALALETYQNSGAADLASLEAAAEELYGAQAGRFYRAADEEQASPLDREHRAKLVSVFRKLRQTPPDALFKPLSRRSGDALEAASTDVRFSQGSSWLQFENPAGSSARAPGPLPSLDDGLPASALWRLESFRVEWGEQTLSFVYRLNRLADARSGEGPAPELGALMLDTYIDLNQVVGAGATAMLEDRGGFLPARDAWEYALVVSAHGAQLFRSNPLGKSLPAAKGSISVDPEKREVRVMLARSALRGNPMRWGFVVCSLALDPAQATRVPPRPQRPDAGASLLGALAPLELQKTLVTTSRPRLPALRAR